MSTVKVLLIWGLFAFFLALGFLQAREISRFSGASLRFNTPVSGSEAYRARQFSVNNADSSNVFWPTFWREGSVDIDAGIRQRHVSAIYFSGDASLVWPMDFIVGTAPSSLDGNGVAVSEATAHALWGSTDIVGLPVYVNDMQRTVRGVFSGAYELVLVGFHIEDMSQYFTAAELSESNPRHGITRAEAETFAISAGLGRPDYILTGGAGAFAWGLSVLPLVIPVLYGFFMIVAFLKKYHPAMVVPLFFAGIILFAILLPFLLGQIADWLIPTHWSDFSFWGALFGQASGSLREFLSVNPAMRDVELRLLLLRQIFIVFIAVCCGIFSALKMKRV